MIYKTGTYIMRCQKEWDCDFCKEKINLSNLYFNRIKEFGETFINQKGENYRHKTYMRYHIACAKENLDLSTNEVDLLKEYKSKINPNERQTQKEICSFLNYQELKNNLFFTKNYVGTMKAVYNNKEYKLGRKGFPDLSIFLNNGIVLFVELKSNGVNLNEHQIKFKEKIINLGYHHFVINSLKELKKLIICYNI